MTTITIQIGNSDDKLTQKDWSDFVFCVQCVVDSYASEIHFFGASVNWEKWQNAAWVIVVEDIKLLALKKALMNERKAYKQDSIALTEGKTYFV